MSFASSSPPLAPSSPGDFDLKFSRTQCTSDHGLHLLHSAIAFGASYDSAERYPPPRCHPQTRKAVFEIILAWTNNAQHGPPMLWVNGGAGSGKTAISQTVAEYCAQSGQLGATFFFSHGKGDLSDGRLLFPTIAYKLARSIPALRVPLSRAIHSNPSILSHSLEVQVQKLIVEPFSNIPSLSVPMLVVIDNLDACEGAEIQHLILTLVAQMLIVHRLPLCFFVTSRAHSDLQTTFDTPVFRKLANRIALENFSSDTDVEIFLRSEFETIRQYMAEIPAPWPADNVIDLLVQKSDGQFLYPATILSYVSDPNADPLERLNDVVLAAVSAPSLASTLTSTDQLYHYILSTSPDPATLLRVLGSLSVMYAPLPTTELERIIGLGPGDMDTTLRDIHALVDVPGSPPHSLRIRQQFTKEFLVDIHRSLVFWIETGKYHAEMARGCIRFIGEMDSLENIDLASYQYVRRKWTRHLAQAIPSPELLEDLCDLRFVYSRLPSETREVVAWLQSLPIPPPDVLDLWQTWQAQLRAQTAYYVP
ncbi:hypothetical protein B0H16DRAFT_1723543 [Mycena metata]|uniref:Nephrocystin 3-like N-terminal domain-containing protein n=1 Tax=Mycena metata TaxID=1033252 RepID=A0AAD7IXT6_9AGAR|nr:hypothetical protein B0H16DRAFT_1723543 [Mycena metata]